MISYERVELGRLVYPDLDLGLRGGGATVGMGLDQGGLDICGVGGEERVRSEKVEVGGDEDGGRRSGTYVR